MRLLTSPQRSTVLIGLLLATGCGTKPPPATPTTPTVQPPPVVAPVTVTPPGISPPAAVQPPVAPKNASAAPTTKPAATTPPVTPQNAQPDLVNFGPLWSPKGPYDPDYVASDRPKLSDADRNALITQAMADLDAAGDDAAKQERALVVLQRANQDAQRRDEVSQRLETLLSSPAKRVQMLATQSCTTWGTRANLPSLKKLAQLDDPHVSNDAVWAIYCVTDLGTVAPYLALPFSYDATKRAFAQERKGEELIWPLLKSSDPQVVYHALTALFPVATPQSLGHLVELKQHPDIMVSRTSQAVVNQIQKRQQ